MPRDSYEELLTPLNEGAVGGVENKDVEYDGKNMEAVVALLDFLSRRLDKVKNVVCVPVYFFVFFVSPDWIRLSKDILCFQFLC